MSQGAKSAILSALLLAVVLLAWHIGTLPKGGAAQVMDPEYAKLMGLDKPKSDGLPTLAQMGETIWKQVSDPFYDAGSTGR
jgi:nitrate/nitrite transport system permease protein